MKKKIILVDCDGVLLDWNSAFNDYMTALNLPQVPNTEDQYSISIRHDITAVAAEIYTASFNESSRVSALKPFADSVKYVEKLAGLGFRFIVITSISDASKAKVYRTENLKRVFGDVFDETVCLKMGASKAAELKRWAGTDYFWIEDHMRQAEAGYEHGLKTILINHPYNTHYKTDLFPTVSFETPWQEIYSLVCKEYNL